MSVFYFDFRANVPFVTDPANAAPVVADAYPITRNGQTYGWTVANGNTQDQNAANIPQLAGNNYNANGGSTKTWVVDLAALGGAGTYKVGLALGDGASAQGLQLASVTDGNGGTTLFTVGPTDMGTANHFIDATGIVLAEASWLASQGFQTVTFTGTQAAIVLGGAGAASGFTCVACLSLEKVTTATLLPPPQGNGGSYQ